jgi:putative nucleotidyltransferase
VLYLNQMGVFNFVDDNCAPGCALLKLSDGRKRSMSLWVEFITASGYLSARKIRARFYTLVAQACDKCACKDLVKLQLNDAAKNGGAGSEVKLRVRDQYTVNVVPAFKCNNIWPRNASQWPQIKEWPPADHIAHVKNEGFHLLSKESPETKEKQQQQQQPMQQQQQQSSSEGN